MKLERQTKLEFRPIMLAGIDLKHARNEGALVGRIHEQGITLTSQLYRFLELMEGNQTLYNIVQYHFKKNVRMSFGGLKQLLVFLVDENHIDDSVFKEQFTVTRETVDLQKVVDNIKIKVQGRELGVDMADAQRQVSDLPFFRSLNFELLDLFFANSKVVPAAKNIAVCQAGQKQRSLYVQLTGSSSVWQRLGNGQKRKITTLRPGAIFGEVGFFLGEPRGQDVVMDEDSILLMIKYNPETMDSVFQSAHTQEMSNRLWLVQAMLKSQMFRSIPSDNFHEVVVTGRLKEFANKDVLFREDDPAEHFYVLVKGQLDVYRKLQKITSLQPGEIIGETGMLLNGGKCAESIVCEGDVLVLDIDREDFHELLASNFSLAIEIEKVALQRLKK